MEKYQVNTNLYKEQLKSYTANDEFDLNTRVHMTNEIPPEDLFKMSHSLLQNEFWEWFLGTSYVDYDVDYNSFTDGAETFYQDGTLNEMSIAKYVNGARALNYGPIPTKKWNSETQSFESKYPSYKRIELTGVLLPEVDLFLHEGYRYLDALYPNHPDFLEILTKNEFDDKIAHAAYLINYYPDLDFFDWLSTYLEYDDVEANKIPLAMEDEAAKLKIRNLLNYAYTQKYAGSKTGYRMFGSDIFQHISVFQVGEYLPIKSFQATPNKTTDIEWNIDIEKTPTGFKNKVVDYTHQLYKRLFRIIDFTNESYEYDKRHDEPITYYATAYPTPKNKYSLYEYPLERVDDTNISLTKLSMAEDFKSGDAIKIGGQANGWTNYTNANLANIHKEKSYTTKVSLTYSGSTFKSGTIQTVPQEDAVTHALVDVEVEPVYTTLKVYPNLDELFDALNAVSDSTKKAFIVKKIYATRETGSIALNYNSLRGLYAGFYDATAYADLDNKTIAQFLQIRTPQDDQFILDPHQNGALIQPPAQTLSQYEDSLKMTVDYNHKTITYAANQISNKAFIHEKDILMYNHEGIIFVSEVDAINDGYLQFRNLTCATSSEKVLDTKIKEVADQDASTFGAIVKLKNDDKFVVLYGKPTLEKTPRPDASQGMYYVQSSTFDITAIPEYKDHATIEYLYPQEIANLSTKKLKSLTTLFKDNKSLLDSSKAFDANLIEYLDLLDLTADIYGTLNILTGAANHYIGVTSFSKNEADQIRALNTQISDLNNEKAEKIAEVTNNSEIVAVDKEIDEKRHALVSVGYVCASSEKDAQSVLDDLSDTLEDLDEKLANVDETEVRNNISSLRYDLGLDFSTVDAERTDSSFKGEYLAEIKKCELATEIVTTAKTDVETAITNVHQLKGEIATLEDSIDLNIAAIGDAENPAEGTYNYKIQTETANKTALTAAEHTYETETYPAAVQAIKEAALKVVSDMATVEQTHSEGVLADLQTKLESDIKEVEEQITQKQGEYDGLRAAPTQIMDDYMEARKTASEEEHEKIIKIREDYEAAKDADNKKIQDAESERARIKAESEAVYSQRVKDAEKANADHDKNNKQLEADLNADVADLNTKIEACNQEINRIEGRKTARDIQYTADVDTANKELETTLNALKATYDIAMSANHKSQDDLRPLAAVNRTEYNIKITELEKEAENITEQYNADCASAQAENLAALKALKTAYDTDINALNAEIDAQNEEIAGYEADIEARKEKYSNDVDAEFTRFDEEHKSIKKNFEDKMTELGKQDAEQQILIRSLNEDLDALEKQYNQDMADSTEAFNALLASMYEQYLADLAQNEADQKAKLQEIYDLKASITQLEIKCTQDKDAENARHEQVLDLISKFDFDTPNTPDLASQEHLAELLQSWNDKLSAKVDEDNKLVTEKARIKGLFDAAHARLVEAQTGKATAEAAISAAKKSISDKTIELTTEANKGLTEKEIEDWPTVENEDGSSDKMEEEEYLKVVKRKYENLLSNLSTLKDCLTLQMTNAIYELATRDLVLQTTIKYRNDLYDSLVGAINTEYDAKEAEIRASINDITSGISVDTAATAAYKTIFDENRTAFNTLKTTAGSLFKKMPTLKAKVVKAMTDLYTSSSSVFAEPSADFIFRQQYADMLADYVRWLAVEIAIDMTRGYEDIFSANTSTFAPTNMADAITDLRSVDFDLDNIVKNKAFLLKDDNYNLLDSGDQFFGYYQYSFEPKYQDYLNIDVRPEFGASGILTNVMREETDAWDFGTLCTVSTAETHYSNGNPTLSNVTKAASYLKNNYTSSKEITLPVSKTISDMTFTYYVLDRNIYTVNHNKNYARKFSYADPNFMELFLPTEKKNNIRGEEAVFYNVKLHGYTELGSTRITFRDDTDKLGYLSTGCQVLGKTIQNDVYIQEINLNENYIEVNTPCIVTGDFDLIILTKVQFMPEEEDHFDFRKRLSKNGLAVVDSLLSYGNRISQASPQGFIDTSSYYDSLLANLRAQDSYKASYNNFVADLYTQNAGNEYVVPSSMDFEGDMFYETNVYRMYGDYLMKTEILDYLEKYLEDLSRASDDVNVGVNVNLYTVDNKSANIDAKINSIRSVTTSKMASSMPYYIKIGTGHLESVFNQSAPSSESSSGVATSHGAIYGYDVYDDNVYDSDTTVAAIADDFIYKDIDKPLFKVQLGENEVFSNISLDSNYGRLTAVQFSVIKQQIQNLKYELGQVNLAAQKLDSAQIIDNMPEGYKDSSEGYPLVFNYLGEFIPTFEKSQLQYPKAPEVKTALNYYTITTQFKVGNTTYYSGDILVYVNNSWAFRKLRFAGFLNFANVGVSNVFSGVSGASLGVNVTSYTNANMAKNLSTKKNTGVAYYYVTTNNTNSTKNTKLGNGQMVVLIYNGSKWQLGKLSDSIVTMSSKLETGYAATAEFNTYTYAGNVNISRNLTMADKRARFTNVVSTRDKNFLKGSSDIRLKLQPDFKCKGFAYNTDGTIDKSTEVEIMLTENNIFVDDTNKVLYTYNFDVTSSEYKKYAIIQEDNKYFKNVLSTIGNYSEYQSVKDDGVEQISEISPVQGLPFDLSAVSTLDEILTIEPIRIRHSYNTYAEPALYSNYYDLSAYCSGYNNSTGVLTLTFKPGSGPVSTTTNKMNFKTELTNLLPEASENDVVIDFNNSEFDSPVAFDASVYKDIASDVSSIKYFKNNLLFEGTLDQSSPNQIKIESLDAAGVLGNLQISDKAEVRPISLGDVGFNAVQVKLGTDSVAVADKIKHAVYNTSLRACVATSATKIYYKNEANNTTALSNGGWRILQGYDNLVDVNSLCFSPREGTFVASVRRSADAAATLIKISIAEGAAEASATTIFDASYYDVNTYQTIKNSEGKFAARDFCLNASSNPAVNHSGKSTSAGKVTTFILSARNTNNAISVDKPAFIYDNDTNRWVLGTGSNLSIAGLSTTSRSKVVIYHINENITVDNWSGNANRWLQYIPLPENRVDTYTIVYGDTSNVSVTMTNLDIVEANERDFSTTSEVSGTNIPSKVVARTAMYLSSENGNEAIIDGNTIYLYNATSKFSNDNNILSYGSLSTQRYWKRASIPAFKTKSFETLMYLDDSYMSADRAYDFVNAARTLVLDASTQTSSELKTWITSNPVLTPDECMENGKWKSSIKISDILVQETVDGYTVTCSAGTSQTLQADRALPYFFSDNNVNYLGKALYIRYLMIYFNGILDGSNGINFDENIKYASLTDDALTIITNNDDVLSLPMSFAHNRDSIENYRNWKLINFNEYSYFAADSTYSRTIYTRSGLQSFGWPKLVHKNLYSIDAAYFAGPYQILCGKLQATQDYAKFVKAVDEANPTAAKDMVALVPWKSSYETPTNDFADYPHEFCKVSTNGGQSYITLNVTGEIMNSTVGGNNANQILGVYGAGSYAYINYSTTLEGRATAKFAKVFVPTMTVSSREDAATNQNQYLSTSYSFKDDSTAVVRSDVTLNGTFMVTSPISYGQCTIQKIDADSETITVAYGVHPSVASTAVKINVIVSVSSMNVQIENPWQYISYSDGYFDSVGKLKVPECTMLEATNSNKADRCYMIRECMTETERTAEPLKGLVSYTEDKAYREASEQYVSPYVIEDDDYVAALNWKGNKIILCDSDGNYLLSRDKGIVNNVLTLADRLQLTTFNADIYPSLMEFNSSTLSTDLDTSFTDLNTRTYTVKTLSASNDDLKIELHVTGSTLNSAIVGKTIKLSLSVPYKNKYGIYRSSTRKFVLTYDETAHQNRLGAIEGKVFNYAYLPINGYGSSIDLDSWNLRRPELNDPEAFEAYDLKNINGELVYACDMNGQKIFVKNGRFIATRDGYVDVNYRNLADKINYFVKKSGNTTTKGILYRRDPTPINIYLPTSQMKVVINDQFDRGTNGTHVLGYMSFNRSGVDIESSAVRYKVLFVDSKEDETFSKYIYKDRAFTTLATKDDLYYDFTTKKILCKDIYLAKESLYVKVIDTYDNTYSVEPIHITTKLDDTSRTIKVTNIQAIKCESNKVLQNNANIEIDFDMNSSVSPSLEFDTKGTVTFTAGSTSKPKTETIYHHKVVFNLTKDIDTVKIAGQEIKLKKNNYDLEVLYITTNTSYVYSGENNVTTEFSSMLSTDKKSLTLAYLDGSKTVKTSVNTENYSASSSGVFVLSADNTRFSYIKGDEVSGIYGPLVLKTPKFEALEDLLSEKGRIIHYTSKVYDAFENDYSEDELITVSKISSRGFDISKQLGLPLKTSVQIVTLPVNTVSLNPKVMNNHDYFVEVPLMKLDRYGFDRVWINPSVNHLPAITVKDKVFSNEYSFKEYTSNEWLNKDGYPVHYCNESGEYCFASGTEVLSFTKIGDVNGDCSETIYQDNDNRITLKQARFTTNFEKYVELEYIKGVKNNIFVPYIHLKDGYDSVKQAIITTAEVEKLANKNGSLVYQKDENYSVEQTNYYDSSNFHKTPYIDHTNGKIKFGVFVNENMNLYGINILTGLDNDHLSKPVNSSIDASYILFSAENAATREKDSAIVGITEVGIFDKYDNLLAYATHPPVQYRTDTQHISYTWIIKPNS